MADTHMKLPTLILVRGMPGSGKSHLAAELRHELGNDLVVALDPDATDYGSKEYQAHTERLTQEGVDPKLHAYRFLRGQAYDGIVSGKIIIWDQPFTNLEIFNTMVERLRVHASEHGKELSILVVEVEIDPATATARVMHRKQRGGHGPSDKTLAARISDYRTFAAEGYQTVVVRGDGDVRSSVASVLDALHKLWAD